MRGTGKQDRDPRHRGRPALARTPSSTSTSAPRTARAATRCAATASTTASSTRSRPTTLATTRTSCCRATPCTCIGSRSPAPTSSRTCRPRRPPTRRARSGSSESRTASSAPNAKREFWFVTTGDQAARHRGGPAHQRARPPVPAALRRARPARGRDADAGLQRRPADVRPGRPAEPGQRRPSRSASVVHQRGRHGRRRAGWHGLARRHGRAQPRRLDLDGAAGDGGRPVDVHARRGARRAHRGRPGQHPDRRRPASGRPAASSTSRRAFGRNTFLFDVQAHAPTTRPGQAGHGRGRPAAAPAARRRRAAVAATRARARGRVTASPSADIERGGGAPGRDCARPDAPPRAAQHATAQRAAKRCT